MASLHEQIEALPLQGESVMSQRAAILDIIDRHECYQQGLMDASEASADAWAEHVCIPDRDTLARALQESTNKMQFMSRWGRPIEYRLLTDAERSQVRDAADAIIARLREL